MNRRGLYFGIAHSLLFVVFKLFILYGGYSLTRFGWFYSNVVGVFLIYPFFYFAIKSARDKDYGGVIGGKEAMRVALTVFAVAAVLTSIYNYFEFQYSGKDLAIQYYNSQQFMDFLKSQPKVKPEDYQKIIQEQIKVAEVSALKATTGKLFSFTILALGGAFVTSVFMKRR
jgi:hypothetical protein